MTPVNVVTAALFPDPWDMLIKLANRRSGLGCPSIDLTTNSIEPYLLDGKNNYLPQRSSSIRLNIRILNNLRISLISVLRIFIQISFAQHFVDVMSLLESLTRQVYHADDENQRFKFQRRALSVSQSCSSLVNAALPLQSRSGAPLAHYSDLQQSTNPS
ncbi:hypothetical protein WH47_01440 [Habropoda laboriosa]|uniref:Uncharacterized protein n=1 Tax=Habropoda laboriosa TaxID=597456 RepID=A0A0L7R5B2_9HYME|nr:hypothetical protein WH47_01440 [Habropoda laboriosa]